MLHIQMHTLFDANNVATQQLKCKMSTFETNIAAMQVLTTNAQLQNAKYNQFDNIS